MMPENELIMWLICLFLVMNVMSFLIMAWDKRQAKNRDSERISEGLLFFLATIFGSVGVYVGMFVLRHKTRRWYFVIGIPMIIMQNCFTLYVIYVWCG